MIDVPHFVPTHPHLCIVWEQISPKSRRQRLREALYREESLKEVQSCVASGASEREAVALLRPWTTRSTYRRWQKKHDAYGLDGLLDWRMPQQPETPARISEAICTLRRVDPQMDVNVIIEHVKKHHAYEISGTTVKRILKKAGLSRGKGRTSNQEHYNEQRLELGGMKLIEAADVETGYLKSMTDGVICHRDSAAWSSEAFSDSLSPADTADRDEYGRFLQSYNERYCKPEEAALGPGFASVDEKRKDKDTRHFHLSKASDEIIERKLMALLVSPLLGSGRWDGIRVPRGELLEELCGYAYMPSTLELFTRELKYLGVSNTMWEIHARHWFHHTQNWGGERSKAILYIDETNKPVWSDLYCESTKVSSVGRVMPGIEIVSFHTGYGVPLWMVSHSGRAPMVKVVPGLLNKLQEILEGAEVGRVVVIDAEGNSVPFLQSLERGNPSRGWITRLKSSMIEGKEIFNRTNYRSYRNGDRVRMGECDLNDPAGGKFRVRVIEIEHRTKKEITTLGASKVLDPQEWSSEELADIYFGRWPNQEANFRAINQAVKFKDVHGYGKQLVDNISVITELDKLENRFRRTQARISQEERKLLDVELELKNEEKSLGRIERRTETVNRSLEKQIEEGRKITTKLQTLFEEQQALKKEVSSRQEHVERLQAKKDESIAKINHENAKQDSYLYKEEELNSRRRIFKHDVELDSIFSVMKVGIVLLITYVLKEYFGNARMGPITFLERVATLPARLHYTPELEILTFEYNRRDPDIMAILIEECEAINIRQLKMRSGRILRIKVDPAPPPRIPPPKNRRTRPGDRFRKN